MSENVENNEQAEQAVSAEQTELEALRNENEELIDTLQRLQADFDNYRKRAARDQESLVARAGERIVKELLTQPSDADEGSVIEVLQKGYRLGDRVLRPARVVVAGPKEEPSGDPL